MLKEYHLHKDDDFKLQLEINNAAPYCQKNVAHCFKPHRHSFFQIIWFQEVGKHFVDYQVYEHPANAVFFLSTGQVHHFCKASSNAGYLFHFNESFLHQQATYRTDLMRYRIFNELEQPFVVLPDDELEQFRFLHQQLSSEIQNQAFNYKQQIFYYFQILLLNIERLKQKQQAQPPMNHHFELALKFKKAVEEHQHEICSVAYYSQLLGISDKTLTNISKKYLHNTPAKIIHQRKVLEAKRLLSNSNLSIKEVAYQLGFEQATYFTKYFKKYTHTTPKAFQQQLL